MSSPTSQEFTGRRAPAPRRDASAGAPEQEGGSRYPTSAPTPAAGSKKGGDRSCRASPRRFPA